MATFSTTPTVRANTIAEVTAASGVTVDGVLLKDGGVVMADGAAIDADTINEATAAAGVTIDGVLLKDGGARMANATALLTDIISEKVAASGVTIDSVLCKDGGIELANGAAIKADIVSEKVGAAGVTVDGVLLKDAQVTANPSGNDTITMQGTVYAVTGEPSIYGATAGDNNQFTFASNSRANLCSYTFPANSLVAGQSYRVRAHVATPNTNAADTLTVQLHVAGGALLDSGAIDVTNDDNFSVELEFQVNVTGVSGKLGTSARLMLPDKSFADYGGGSMDLDTTGTLVVALKGQWSAVHANNDARAVMFAITGG